MPNVEHLFVSGGFSVFVDFPPISQQATGKTKRSFTNRMVRLLPESEVLLSGDVHVTITWRTSHADRYRSHKALDIDNVTKPILDALCSTLLIDDAQVSSVLTQWIDWNRADQGFEIELKFTPDDVVWKRDLEFVDFGRGLCLPMFRYFLDDGSWADDRKNAEIQTIVLDSYRASFRLHDAMSEILDSALSSLGMPIQRIFHRNKVQSRFPVVTAADKDAKLQSILRS